MLLISILIIEQTSRIREIVFIHKPLPRRTNFGKQFFAKESGIFYSFFRRLHFVLPMSANIQKKTKIQRSSVKKASYSQRLQGLLHKAPSKPRSGSDAYPVKRNFILLDTLNKIHAAIAPQT